MGSVPFDFGSEQKFTVVTLEPVTLVFRPKMDGCSLGFLPVSDILLTVRARQRTDLGRALVKGPAFLPRTWGDLRAVQAFLCSPPTCPGRSVFEP